LRRVEHEPGWGWIARDRDGREVVENFRWASRAVARTVAAEADMVADIRSREEPTK
jgi:hypothetical protein